MWAIWPDSSWHRAPRLQTSGCFTPSISKFTLLSNQMNSNKLFSIFCLCSTAHVVGGGESREDRLARRRQSPAYKRAMSNLHLQFIAEFMAEKPLVNPTASSEAWTFDPSGLGEETHFGLWWWLPGLAIVSLIILSALHVKLGVYRHKPATHSQLPCTA